MKNKTPPDIIANSIRFRWIHEEGYTDVYESISKPTLRLQRYPEGCGYPERWEMSFDRRALDVCGRWARGPSYLSADAAVKGAAWEESAARIFGPRPKRRPKTMRDRRNVVA